MGGMQEEGDGKRRHDQQLQGTQHRSRARGQADAKERDHPDDRGTDEREHPPGNVHTIVVLQELMGQYAEEAHGAGRAEPVIEEIGPGRQKAESRSQAAGNKGVIAAGQRHIA